MKLVGDGDFSPERPRRRLAVWMNYDTTKELEALRTGLHFHSDTDVVKYIVHEAYKAAVIAGKLPTDSPW